MYHPNSGEAGVSSHRIVLRLTARSLRLPRKGGAVNDVSSGQWGSGRIPPPHRPSPDGSVSAAPPQGGSSA